MRLPYLITIITMLSLNAFAVISNVTLSPYAKATGDNKTTMTILVGRADVGTAPSGNVDTPEDTCAKLTSFCPNTAFSCNQNSIFPALYLTVSFQTDAAASITATSKIYMLNGTTSQVAAVLPTTYAVNSVMTAKFRWSDICVLNATGESQCDASFSKAFKVGISNDNGTTLVESFSLQVNYRNASANAAFHTDCTDTVDEVASQGVCRFDIFPGDSKVYVQNTKIPASWPTPLETASGITFAGLRVYYQTAPSDAPAGSATASANDWCNNITPASSGYADLTIDAKGGMQRTTVKNLTNEQTYVFLIATYDQAGNITNFSNPLNNTFYDPAVTGNVHYGKPGEVVGLLDGKKCFIATAAFGSEMDPHVEDLRQFRSQFLLKTDWGKSFVRWYYQVSPPLADFIRQHDSLRVAVRVVLWPVLGFAKLSLEYGILFSIFVFAVLGVLIREILKRLQNLWSWK